MKRWGAALVGLVVAVTVAAYGIGALGPVVGSVEVGPSTGEPPSAEKALIISLPRLTWPDVEAVLDGPCSGSVEQACLWAAGLADVGATNSHRAIGPYTSLPEGYVTLGAGNRATVPVTAVRDARQDVSGRWQVAGLDEIVADAEGKFYGAEPGALGQAIVDADLSTAVVAGGPDALLGVMDLDGQVGAGVLDVFDPDVATAEGLIVLSTADVVLVEYAALDAVVSVEPDDPTRSDVVWDTLRAAYDLVLGAPDGTVVVVVSPAPPRDRGQLGVFALLGATTPTDGSSGAVAQSPTTRRPGYVTLTDVAPTVLARLGLDRPSSMNGTPVTSTDAHATVSDFAGIDRLARYRDALVGPISVVYVVLQVVGAFVAMWVIRRRSPGRAAVVAMVMACTVLLVPPIAFVSGAFAYDAVPKVAYVVGLFVLSAVLGAALVFVGRHQRWPVWAPALILSGVALVVQWVDITTGGRLQINTPFGYSPIIAGRFQGFGNLSFAMASAAALVVASAAPLVRPRLDGFAAATWAVTIGALMLISDGVPAFGADVGGVLALIPAFVVLATIVSGRRMNIWKLVIAGGAGVAVLAAVAAFDMSRAESQRTHLGRFASKMLDGEAGIIIRRKINANLGILTSSVWTWLVPVMIVFFVVVARRRGGTIARLNREIPGVRAFLGASLVLAVIGFAVNDSGVAIPAAMAGLVLPWVTALALSLPAPGTPDEGTAS